MPQLSAFTNRPWTSTTVVGFSMCRSQPLGGIIPAIEAGFFEKAIADAAFRHQQELDHGAGSRSPGCRSCSSQTRAPSPARSPADQPLVSALW